MFSVFPPTSLAFDLKFDQYYSFDLEKAKELITQAGYPNGFEATVLATTAVNVWKLPHDLLLCWIVSN